MGRQLIPLFVRIRCAIALQLLLCACVLWGGRSLAQEVPVSDAARIEQMRDQAGKASAGDDSIGPASSPSPAPGPLLDGASQADAQPLPANESLPLGAGEGDLFSHAPAQSGAGSLGDGWLMSTLAALGVVLAIVFGIRWLLRRGGVVSTTVTQGSVVEVLSRTTVAPRSHVVLMRVGQRVLVVSDSPAGMQTLASVHEAEEVAELLGAIDASKPTSMSHSFGAVMKKLSGQWSGEDDGYTDTPGTEPDQPQSVAGQAEGALSRVRGRLAELSDTGGRA